VDFAQLGAVDDAEVIGRLTRVKGIGVWTVHMFLIFALRRQDVLPIGDLGIRAAMRKAYGMEELPAPAEMERLAAPWRPWRTVASWYLWRSQEPDANL
jgi:DNA-3-methyladenine glycosylase II